MFSTLFLLTIFFLSLVFLLTAKKNVGVAAMYAIQSFVIVLLTFGLFLETGSIALLVMVFLTFVVKVILAPLFLVRLIRKHQLTFSVNTYLNTSLTLVVVAILAVLAHSRLFLPLTDLVPANADVLFLALLSILTSLFLIINRRGAFSQVIGVLSLENSIVAFGMLAGLEQSLGLQVGMMFEILVWFIIATAFVSMIYRHFGSLDVTTMTHLQD